MQSPNACYFDGDTLAAVCEVLNELSMLDAADGFVLLPQVYGRSYAHAANSENPDDSHDRARRIDHDMAKGTTECYFAELDEFLSIDNRVRVARMNRQKRYCPIRSCSH